MSKFIFTVIFLFGSIFMGYAANKTKIGGDYFSIDELSKKVKITPIIYPDNGENLVYHQDIGNDEGAYLLRNMNTLDYKFYNYNYSNQKIYNEVHIEKDKIEHSPECVYFTEEYFYTIEKEEKGKILVKRNFFGDIKQTWCLSLDNSDSIRAMIVNEKQDCVILECSKTKNILIYSLRNNYVVFQDNGKLLFDASNESGRVCFSKINELFFIDYDSEIKTNAVKTFVNSNEEIVEFQKVNNNYILVTEKKKRNWFLSIVFGTSDWSNIYYYCSLKNNKVEKIEKIHTKNKGIMF